MHFCRVVHFFFVLLLYILSSVLTPRTLPVSPHHTYVPRVLMLQTCNEQVLLQVANLQPCAGIRASHYPDEDMRRGFNSAVLQALRHGQPQDGPVCMGHFPGFDRESVSSILRGTRQTRVLALGVRLVCGGVLIASKMQTVFYLPEADIPEEG